MTLRGFDSYKVTLGDEMRGERASLGKSLMDAERNMRIKAPIIEAIENCDLSGFPNQSVIAGYVRSYARYLGMDPEETFRRFCAESGYVSPSALRQGGSMAPAGSPSAAGEGAALDPIMRSRFAAPASPGSFRPRVSFGALTSTVALLALICGLGYGGYALLQDIQRVGFAPLPEAPAVVADAPVIASPAVDMAPVPLPVAEDYTSGGVLAAIVMPTELPDPDQTSRDGPISAIDPARAGLFRQETTALAARSGNPDLDDFGKGLLDVGEDVGNVAMDRPGQEVLGFKGDGGVVLVASEEAWVRVRDGGGAILYEGILGAGERYDLPQRLVEPVLRAGNAGGIFIMVDGVAYGPLGERGRVVSGVSLRAQDVRTRMPQAQPELVQPAIGEAPEQRADAAHVTADR